MDELLKVFAELIEAALHHRPGVETCVQAAFDPLSLHSDEMKFATVVRHSPWASAEFIMQEPKNLPIDLKIDDRVSTLLRAYAGASQAGYSRTLFNHPPYPTRSPSSAKWLVGLSR